MSAQAAKSLASVGPSAVLPLIGIVLGRDESSETRRRAADALGRIGDLRATEPLITALGDSDYMIRHIAARALERLRDGAAVEALIEALRDPNGFVSYGST